MLSGVARTAVLSLLKSSQVIFMLAGSLKRPSNPLKELQIYVVASAASASRYACCYC
jgi:hypothetical protein